MITREQLAGSLIRECEICEHLFTKFAPGALEYRPSPSQRSTLELLRYLAICGISGIRCMHANDWKLFAEFRERVRDMDGDGFPAAMARQKDEILEFFAGVDERMFVERMAPLPPDLTQPLGLAIVNGPLKWLAAYKLQLFSYAKACGAQEIGTANAWAGIDWKK